MQIGTIHFTLDSNEDGGEKLSGYVMVAENGIEISFNGFSTATEDPEAGTPIFIENRNGIPHVLVWSDIQQEDPTDSISLENASSDRALPGITDGSQAAQSFWVQVQKSYYLESDTDNTTFFEGVIQIEATSREEAIAKVEEMMIQGLQTCDRRILWDDERPDSDWVYEDFSFEATGEVLDSSDDYEFSHR